jgi:hypothetical protein
MTAANHRVAPDGAKWHDSILAAPDEVILCWAFNHRWIPGPVVDRPGYGGTVTECRAECPCDRKRLDTMHPDTFELLARSYSGGHRLRSGVASKIEARAEWFRRIRAKASAGRSRKRRRAGQQQPSGAGSTTTAAAEPVAATSGTGEASGTAPQG